MKFANLKNLLSIPDVYKSLMKFLTNDKVYAAFVNEYINPRKGDKVLDIGCGPARVFNFLSDVEYVGLDMSQSYIDAARTTFGNRGKFICERLDEKSLRGFKNYDLVLALGVIHHLNDEEAVGLFKIAKKILKPGGRLITLDGCFRKGQSRLERFILTQDRGKYIRTEDQYCSLASQAFVKMKTYVRSDLISIIPYTHIIVECTV